MARGIASSGNSCGSSAGRPQSTERARPAASSLGSSSRTSPQTANGAGRRVSGSTGGKKPRSGSTPPARAEPARGVGVDSIGSPPRGHQYLTEAQWAKHPITTLRMNICLSVNDSAIVKHSMSTTDAVLLRYHHLMRALRTERARRGADPWSECPMTMPQLRALSLIAASQRGLSSRELAAMLAVGASAVTPLVDRLVERGFARRTEDPHDRRIARLDATELGAARRRGPWLPALRVGDHRILAHKHGRRADLRQVVGYVWPQVILDRQLGHVRVDFRLVRPQPGHDPAHRVSRPAGCGRRRAHVDRLHGYLADFSARRTWPNPGRLQRHLWPGQHRRTAPWRLPDRQPELALGLLREPARRADRADRAVVLVPQCSPGRPRAAHRLPRRPDPGSRGGTPTAGAVMGGR